MIPKNRLFTREEPSEEAKSIYIFCEGMKREVQYFNYFQNIDSRINIEVYPLHKHENNSPLGLLEIAKKCIIQSLSNPNPKYSFQKNDEVWILIDRDIDKLDSRKPQIIQLLKECNAQKDWFIARSNPCFEVWLYYHFYDSVPHLEEDNACKSWKQLVSQSINGGFNSKKHPIYINKVIKNAEKNFKTE